MENIMQPWKIRAVRNRYQPDNHRRFLEFNGRDEAQDVVPELDDVHLSLESVDKAYQDAVQSVGI